MGAFTFAFTDRIVKNPAASRRDISHVGRSEDVWLLRLVIGQFLASDQLLNISSLDLSQKPYKGEIRNAQGEVLSVASFHKA